MVYSKPELYVENFIPSIAVAASCQRDFSGQTETKYEKQPITCIRMGSTTDYIFSSGVSGCDYRPNAIGWLDGPGTPNNPNDSKTYTTVQISQILGYNIQGTGSPAKVTKDDGEYYVIWGDGHHYGPATAEVTNIMINSY